jgi:hypothetical protein
VEQQQTSATGSGDVIVVNEYYGARVEPKPNSQQECESGTTEHPLKWVERQPVPE